MTAPTTIIAIDIGIAGLLTVHRHPEFTAGPKETGRDDDPARMPHAGPLNPEHKDK